MKRIQFLVPIIFACFFSTAQISIPEMSYDFASSDYGKKYLEPIGQVYSSLLHSGVFPRYSEKGFHIKIGVHVTRFNLYSNVKTFDADGQLAPTIVGSPEPLLLSNTGGETLEVPGGNDKPTITLGAPELYIGTLLGTDFYGRYGQLPEDGNLGRLEFYGGGVRHDFGRYFLPEYVKWYLSYSYHQLSLGETVTSINQYGLTQLGLQLNRIGFYGLFGYEFNDMTLDYTFENTPTTIDLDDAVPFRYGGGFNLSFKHVELYGEYNMNDPVAILLGFSVGI